MNYWQCEIKPIIAVWQTLFKFQGASISNIIRVPQKSMDDVGMEGKTVNGVRPGTPRNFHNTDC